MPFPHRPTTLLTLPLEIQHAITLALVAQTPLGPPSQLPPLLRTCRTLHVALLDPSLLARIFRFKFDAGAVERRLFKPNATDLADQLILWCRVIKKIKRGLDPNKVDDDDDDDEEDDSIYKRKMKHKAVNNPDYGPASDLLITALLMLLDNDGKNYAQLVHYASIHTFLSLYLNHRLWHARDTNEGWPLDHHATRSALWCLWLTTERERLEAETVERREEIILLILPFVLVPHRYAASVAPPNHFKLPLSSSSFSPTSTGSPPLQQEPLQFHLPFSKASYPHYTLPGPTLYPYFHTLLDLIAPLASIAAKLLFVSRREVRDIAVPAHLPPGPGVAQGAGGLEAGLTQADYHELNKGKAAPLPRGALWDWEAGVARVVNVPLRASSHQNQSHPKPPSKKKKKPIIPFTDPESLKYDDTFWRMRLCCNYTSPKPKFIPGEVYKRGATRGLWQGKIYIPQLNLYSMMMHNPLYPGVPNPNRAALSPFPAPLQQQQHLPNPPPTPTPTSPRRIIPLFTESSLGLIMQPVFLDMEEHHRVCLCSPPQEEVSSRALKALLSSSTQKTKGKAHTGPCGVIPVPPLTRRTWVHARHASHGAHEMDVAIGEQAGANANTQNPTGTSTTTTSTTSSSSPPPDLPSHIDTSMSNAWLPGELGGFAFVRRRGAPAAIGAVAADSASSSSGREEIVVAVDFVKPDGRIEGGCRIESESGGGSGSGEDLGSGSGDGSSNPNASTTATSTSTKRTNWVYETYDPTKISSHDAHRYIQPASYKDLGLAALPGSSTTSSAFSFPWSSSSKSTSTSAPEPTPEPEANPTCIPCQLYEAARREERYREAEEARVALDAVMAQFVADAGVDGVASLGKGRERDEEEKDEEKEERDEAMKLEDLDMTAFELAFGLDAAFAGVQQGHSRPQEKKQKNDNIEEERKHNDTTTMTSKNDNENEQEDTSDSSDVEDSSDIEEEDDEGDELSVLGDDLPQGNPEFYESSSPSPSSTPTHPEKNQQHTHRFIPSTRREFDRRRIGVPCSGVRDIIITGSTPSAVSPSYLRATAAAHRGHTCSVEGGAGHHHHHHHHHHQHQEHQEQEQQQGEPQYTGTPIPGGLWAASAPYTTYGRVRPWDGLVGLVRVSRGAAVQFIFIFGYIIGAAGGPASPARRVRGAGGVTVNVNVNLENEVEEEAEGEEDEYVEVEAEEERGTFVGEWRVAGADPVRPAWGGPFVMSRRRVL